MKIAPATVRSRAPHSGAPRTLAALITLAMSGCTAKFVDASGGADWSPGEYTGWRVMSCTPGRRVLVGCGTCAIGSCSGNTDLLVCRGSSVSNCLGDRDYYLGSPRLILRDPGDTACPGPCPIVEVDCPAEGQILGMTKPHSGYTHTCILELREL